MLSIEAKGNFTQKVEDGAYINLSVKYGLIRIINQRTDLCEQMKNIDEPCPLEGFKTVTKDVELPKEIPPVRKGKRCCLWASLIRFQGKYTVLADVYTKGNEKVTCLKAEVHF